MFFIIGKLLQIAKITVAMEILITVEVEVTI
jgi:hypothetical protein